MDDFICTGALCPDTCCQGWEIVIDEATCERYAKMPDGEVRDLLSRAIVHRQEEQADGSSAEIACIRMGKGQRCLFLRNDGWCLIQRKTTETNLSETCRTYPRVIYCWNESYAERALCVSCPEAARLILGTDEPLRFHTKQLPEAELAGLRITDEGEHLRADCLPLRRFIVHILQSDTQPLARRLQLADEFFWAATDCSGHHADKKQQDLQAAFEAQLAVEVDPPALLKNNDAWRLAQLQQLLELRLKNPELRPDFRWRAEGALKGWGMTVGEAVSADSLARYEEDQSVYQLFFLPEYQQLLENYLVNAVFKNLFMTEEQPDYYREWFRLVLQFSLVRCLLIAQLAARQDVPDRESVIELIQQTTRAVGHDALYLDQAAVSLTAGKDAVQALQAFCQGMLQGCTLDS